MNQSSKGEWQYELGNKLTFERGFDDAKEGGFSDRIANMVAGDDGSGYDGSVMGDSDTNWEKIPKGYDHDGVPDSHQFGPAHLPLPLGQYNCQTWSHHGETCHAATLAPLQDLPIEDWLLEETHPTESISAFPDGVHFYVGAVPGKGTKKCLEELVKAISGADITPESPSFSDRCYFCQSHPCACTTTHLSLCKQWEQGQTCGKHVSGHIFQDSLQHLCLWSRQQRHNRILQAPADTCHSNSWVGFLGPGRLKPLRTLLAGLYWLTAMLALLLAPM